MNRRLKSKNSNKIMLTKVLITFILIAIVTTLTVIIVTSKKRPQEVAQIEEVEDTKIADVTDDNIKYEYNKETGKFEEIEA